VRPAMRARFIQRASRVQPEARPVRRDARRGTRLPCARCQRGGGASRSSAPAKHAVFAQECETGHMSKRVQHSEHHAWVVLPVCASPKPSTGFPVAAVGSPGNWARPPPLVGRPCPLRVHLSPSGERACCPPWPVCPPRPASPAMLRRPPAGVRQCHVDTAVRPPGRRLPYHWRFLPLEPAYAKMRLRPAPMFSAAARHLQSMGRGRVRYNERQNCSRAFGITTRHERW